MAPSEFAQVLDASGIHTTRVLHPLVEHTGTKLETLALYPAGKACTMPLTRIGSPGKIEPHGRTGLCRLQLMVDEDKPPEHHAEREGTSEAA